MFRRLLIVFMFTAAAAPSFAEAPIITLSVEQPAYAGMPIWLHVMARDECLEQSDDPHPWDIYLWMRDDGADVSLDGRPLSRLPVASIDRDHRPRIPGRMPCSQGSPPGPIHDHVFALSAAYAFDKPGRYTVHWITRAIGLGGLNGEQATSARVGFTMQPSTPKQREAWIAAMLLYSDISNTSLVNDYIPALLAAAQDPRITRRLIDLLCSGSDVVREAASEALHMSLDPTAATYFAEKVEKACLWPADFETRFLLRHQLALSPVRGPLLRGFAANLNQRGLQSKAGYEALTALNALRHETRSGSGRDPDEAWADDQVLNASQSILSMPAPEQDDYTTVESFALLTYLASPNAPPAAHQLLRAVAIEPRILSEAAFELLVSLKDPADLTLLGDIMSHHLFLPGPTHDGDVRAITSNFGPIAIPMLKNIVAKAAPSSLRVTAAIELLKLGQMDGVPVLEAAMKGPGRSQYLVAIELDKLVAEGVAMGSLAQFCRGGSPGDPCDAAAAVPHLQGFSNMSLPPMPKLIPPPAEH